MAKMNSGVLHEILRALNNLGGQAISKDVIDEIGRMRSVFLSEREISNLRTYLNIYSAKAKSADGKKYFHRVGPGVWALNNTARPQVVQVQRPIVSPEIHTPLTESFETITNTLRTVKEYRDYYDSSSPSWSDYINEIFHILGFGTQQKDSRIFLLSDMGEHNSPKAIVAYNLPGENFEEILPGLTWESYLLFAADYYQLEWGVLTNGLRIKLFNFQNYLHSKPFVEIDFDDIIRNERSDSFFAFYQKFSQLKNNRSGWS